MKHIGFFVAALRKNQGFSQSTFAVNAQIGQPYLSRIESGQVVSPRRSTMLKIFNALGVSEAQFYAIKNDMETTGTDNEHDL
jgi:transcriptional regulator with XRE-family HTH domain